MTSSTFIRCWSLSLLQGRLVDDCHHIRNSFAAPIPRVSALRVHTVSNVINYKSSCCFPISVFFLQIFGLHSEGGKPEWKYLLRDVTMSEKSGKLPLFIQRTTAHFPNTPIATLLARHIVNFKFVFLKKRTGILETLGSINSAFVKFTPAL